MNLLNTLCRCTGWVVVLLLVASITTKAAAFNDTNAATSRLTASPKTTLSSLAVSSATSFADMESCGCQDQVNVQMRGNCVYTLSISQVGAGSCEEADLLVVNDANPGNNNVIDCPGEYSYALFDADGDLICWGSVLAEDKDGPAVSRVDKPYETIPCTFISEVQNNEETVDPSSPWYLGTVFFEDNCGSCGCETETKFYDQVEYLGCEDQEVGFGDEYTYARLRRRFTSTDCEGNSYDTTIVYDFIRPALSDLIPAKDTLVQTCSAAGIAIPVAYPYWEVPFPTADGDLRLGLDEIECNYSVSEVDAEFPVCGGSGKKIERSIRVLDWCTGESEYVDDYIIKIGDFAPPEFEGNAKELAFGLQEDDNRNGRITEDEVIVDLDSLRRLKDMDMVTTISTRGRDCTANISIELDDLERRFGFSIDDCSLSRPSISIYTFGPRVQFGFPTGESIWREGAYPMINGMASGIPVGIHALVMDITDECKNNAQGVVFFQVKDQVSPNMICDDQLNITLSDAGYARVFASDVDEGSTDNCELASLQIRRSVSQDCIDAGSFDVADLVMEDGVYYTPFDNFVEFFCCDAGQNIIIELQGTDAAVDPIMQMPMPNRSICWLDLFIEDKVDPECVDLAPVVTTCDDPRLDDLGDLSDFGEPQASSGNCQVFDIEELDPMVSLDECNIGSITRQFVAVGNGDQSDICTQEITVVARHDYWMRFPADAQAECGTVPEEGTVTYVENGCDLLAVSFEDEVFTATSDPSACYKIFRTYRVINWCEYDGEALPTIVSRDWDGFNGTNPTQPDGDDDPGDEAIFVHVKRDFSDGLVDTVYYDNNDNPNDQSVEGPGGVFYGYWWRVLSGSNDPTEEAYYEGSGSVWSDDGNQTDSDISGNAQSDDNDYRYGSFGFWEYTQHIVVYDDVAPELTVTGQDTFPALDGENCTGEVIFDVIATDICTDDTLDVTVEIALDVGNDGTIDLDVSDQLNDQLFTDIYPIGEHRLIFTADDGCGNTVSVERIFHVVDAKAPSPICLNGIVIQLMASQEDSTGASMEVWASDFIASAIFDCTGQGEPGGDFNLPMITKENYFIVRDEVEDVSEFDPDNPMMGIPFNCNDAGQVVPVEIHAVDSAGNSDYCVAYVQVDDNMGLCSEAEGAGVVSGTIRTDNNVSVEGVEVRLSGYRDMAAMTLYDGAYQFTNLETGYDYSITPVHDHHPRNGVSTADLIMIGEHILGSRPFRSPYQYLAADVNNDQAVTTIDMVQLRALILGITSRFPGQPSWQFVDGDFRFDPQRRPLQQDIPRVRNINNLAGEMEVRFTAVKTGDLNGTANVADTRSASTPLELLVDEQYLQAGREYTIPVYAKNLEQVDGYQFTLETRGADLLEVVSDQIPEEYFGLFREQGILTSSWGRIFAEAPTTGDPLFYLVVRPDADGPLRDVLHLSSRFTKAEAYQAGSLAPVAVTLRVGEQRASAGTVVYQNTPNPFRESTVIGFELAEAGRVTVAFSDVSGKQLQVVEQTLGAGYHQIAVSRNELPATGVIYYTLRTGDFTETRKMLLLR